MKLLSLTVLLLLSFFAVAPQLAFASTVVRTGEAVTISDDQRVEGDFYFLTSAGALQGDVEGDLLGVAGSLQLGGTVAQDVTLLLGTITVGETASITDDMRIVGGDVVIAGTINGSLMVIGNSLRLLSTARVGGDILFVGREAVIEGSVGGQLLGRGETMRIDGTVESGVDVVTSALTLGDKASVTGDIRYESNHELNRALGAVVTGEVVRGDVPSVAVGTISYRGMALSFLISLFASLSLFLVAKRALLKFARFSAEKFGLHALLGAAGLILLPIVITTLLISVLGAFLGFIGLAIFLLLFIIAIPLINIVIAALITKTLMNKVELNVIWITVGAAVVQLLVLIPIIGPVMLFVLILSTLGALVATLYSAVKAV